MGPDSDPLAVTDATGRVYGSENLYVADSSLFPTCPRGNIHFAVVAAAGKDRQRADLTPRWHAERATLAA